MSRYHNFFIHLSVDGHVGCFHVLPIVNSAAMNNEYMCLLIIVSSVYMPWSAIAGSYGGFIPSKTYFQTKLSPYHKDMNTSNVAVY